MAQTRYLCYLIFSTVKFVKYQGTGNDFILVDDRSRQFAGDEKQIEQLCSRHFGIGADGLLLLRTKEGFDFEMVYYNSDGSFATFCGNGARCIVAFARSLGLLETDALFCAADGTHRAKLLEYTDKEALVSLQMTDVAEYQRMDNSVFLNTGTEHLVCFVKNVSEVDVLEEGRKLRYAPAFGSEGTNVNFVERSESVLKIRTYEKGVEGETLSCGTGATAAALATALKQGGNNFVVNTLGGNLTVKFDLQNQIFTHIRLIGPAVKVFEGVF